MVDEQRAAISSRTDDLSVQLQAAEERLQAAEERLQAAEEQRAAVARTAAAQAAELRSALEHWSP